MPLAIAEHTSVDPYLAWQAAHGVALCHRMASTISLEKCEYNQRNLRGDYRCRGCAGLFSQDAEKQVRRNLSLERSIDRIIEKSEANARGLSPAAQHGSVSTSAEKDAFAALDAIIDGLIDDPLPGDDLHDLELDLDDEQLLALFPELELSEEEDNEINYPRFTEYQTAMPRYAVYRGRCKKCGGYVENCRERQDDNVFRCLSCGWRTGPEYANNRKIQSAGGLNE